MYISSLNTLVLA